MLQKSFLSSGRLSSVLLAVMVLGVRAGYSQIIPAGRMPPGGVWHAGVPGGIPNRTTIYQTLSPGVTAAQIAAACQSCPSNQVVFLSAGTYHLNGAIEWYNNYGASGNSMTLRGAGLTNTILIFTNASWVQAPIQIEGPDRYGNGYPDSAGSTNSYILSLASGYTQGSTNLTLSAPQNASLIGTHSALQRGTVICIDQLNDSFVDVIGSDGGFQLDASALRDNGTRAQQQYVVVQSISNGTNLTIWPPIYMTNYQASLKPQIWWWGASMEMSGIENMTIDVSSSQHTYPILFWSCDACWAKNVHIIKGANSSVYTYNCANIEVRDSFFDQSQSYGSGSYGVQFSLASACLCENNIFSTLTTPMMASQGASGNVFSYNFCTNGTYYTTGNAWMPPSIEPHYVHNHMNLFEGNYGTGVELDFTHGSASHNTLFRNRLHGPERSTQVNNTFAIQVQATNWWMNIVGNVLGTVGWHNVYSISVTSPASDNDGAKSIYKFGFVDDSGSTTFGDPKAQGTALIHGNWDAVTATNGGIVWDPTISTHTLPASLYLSGKPSWWGNAPWPPFDPANPSYSATNLPAAYRFIFGANPPSGGATNLPPVAVAGGSPLSGTVPLTVIFSSAGSSDPEGATLTYSWQFGDGASATTANPSHTYASAGTFSAVLTVSDGTNTTPATAITVTATNTVAATNRPPVAVAGGAPLSGTVPLTVNFSSAGSSDPEGATLTYSWQFGDGATATTANPSHTYASAGTFSAHLSVSDGTNTTPATAITITATNAPGTNRPPVAVAGGSPLSGTVPLTVIFSSAGSSDPEGATLTYSWQFGDGATATTANPSHTYASAGTFSAHLSVSDGTNTTPATAITITATNAPGTNRPPVAVAGGSPLSGTVPLTVIFSSAGSSDPEGATLTYSWQFGDGATATTANPSHTYASAGTFSAHLSVSDGTNTTPATAITITATNAPGTNRPPVAVANASATVGATPLSVTFSSAGSSDPEGSTLTYSWVFGDGTTSTAANPSHTYSTAGTYSALLTVSDGTNQTSATAISITTANVSNGPVAVYGFDEGTGATALDTSGNGNTGAVNAGTWTKTGKFGGALSFNGTSSSVTVNDSASLDISVGMTLEAWVNPTALNAQQGMNIIVKLLVGSSSVDYVLLGSAKTTRLPSTAISATLTNLSGSSLLPLNTWSHLAATYDGATMRLYVNGVQVASAAQTGPIANSSQPLTIGSNWSGLIDEVRIYNRALSAGQILTDMNTAVDPPPAPPSNLRLLAN